jgi:cephalosporin-C deacetylase-like acetyl esterase
MRLSFCLIITLSAFNVAQGQQLPGTAPLDMKGDLAAQMVDGMHKYLDKAIDKSVEGRKKYWKPVFSSMEAYVKSIEPNRERLKKLIGLVDSRVPMTGIEYVATTDQPALVAETKKFKVYAVRWPVLKGMDAEGLLLEPTGKVKACVVAIPDADQTPEQVAGLVRDKDDPKGLKAFGQRLAEHGCRVLIPTLIDRKDTWSNNPAVGRVTNQPHREFVWRMAYEMGRHIIGYEVQKVLAGVDWFAQKKVHPPIGVIGYGEGGLIALYSGAVDTRIKAVGVSGYFDQRDQLWKEPIYRSVWGLLQEFGDAEIGRLIFPRNLSLENHPGPQISGPSPAKPGKGGAAPGGTLHFGEEGKGQILEFKRLNEILPTEIKVGRNVTLTDSRKSPLHSEKWLNEFFGALFHGDADNIGSPTEQPTDQRQNFDSTPRFKAQFDQAVHFTQDLLPGAVKQRDKFWSKMDTSALDRYTESTKAYRDYFHDEIIGKLPPPTKPMNPKTRLIYNTPKWKGYEVVLDLYDDVFCYGILLVPNDIKPGEKRPVVVCQHGLEGKPTDICDPKKKTVYNSFGAQLADRGFIVFAPQAPYIGGNHFRQLVRKGHPLKISLYSFIVAQHERILDWLVTLDFVDPQRIAFYGLSYGGKVAMRIGALITRYCAIICSGDFNEWIWKNITLLWQNSYMFTGEYDMYEFDLANTYNYAEMARLIAPRPFMVERGHHDGVGLDEWVAHEYARVRYIYGVLKIPQKTEIEFFLGGHEIHGQGTFAFLHKHLNWPALAKSNLSPKTAEGKRYAGPGYQMGRALPHRGFALGYGQDLHGADARHCGRENHAVQGPGTGLRHGHQQHLAGATGLRRDGAGYFAGCDSTGPRHCLESGSPLPGRRRAGPAQDRGSLCLLI